MQYEQFGRFVHPTGGKIATDIGGSFPRWEQVIVWGLGFAPVVMTVTPTRG